MKTWLLSFAGCESLVFSGKYVIIWLNFLKQLILTVVCAIKSSRIDHHHNVNQQQSCSPRSQITAFSKHCSNSRAILSELLRFTTDNNQQSVSIGKKSELTLQNQLYANERLNNQMQHRLPHGTVTIEHVSHKHSVFTNIRELITSNFSNFHVKLYLKWERAIIWATNNDISSIPYSRRCYCQHCCLLSNVGSFK